MGRGRRREEIQFGSDSFLDVIANIVGILVIMLVLVGLRVKHAPLSESEARQSQAEFHAVSQPHRQQEWESAKGQIEAENDRRRHDHAAARQRRADEIARRDRRLADYRAAQAALDRQHVDQLKEVDRRNQQIAAIEREAAALADEIAALAQIERTGKQHRDAKRQADTQAQQEAERLGAEIRQLRTTIAERSAAHEQQRRQAADLEQSLAALRQQMDQLRDTANRAKTWLHFTVPISKTTDQYEIHFRCLNGRIAAVPMDELIKSMQNHVQQHELRRQWTMSGTVGPIDGFSLHYLLRRAERTAIEEAHQPGAIRVELVGFELTGADELGSPFDEAFGEGSSLRRVLARHAPNNCSATLWVYPDAFGLAKRAQTWFHENGYTVALRPLPSGVRIGASPQGSASRIQ